MLRIFFHLTLFIYLNKEMELILHDITIQQALLIILNLIIIESLLSVDNAAVLATMVMDFTERATKQGFKVWNFRCLCFQRNLPGTRSLAGEKYGG